MVQLYENEKNDALLKSYSAHFIISYVAWNNDARAFIYENKKKYDCFEKN